MIGIFGMAFRSQPYGCQSTHWQQHRRTNSPAKLEYICVMKMLTYLYWYDNTTLDVWNVFSWWSQLEEVKKTLKCTKSWVRQSSASEVWCGTRVAKRLHVPSARNRVSTLVLVRSRVFFDYRNRKWYHLNNVQNSRDLLFWEKKATARNAPGLVRMCFYQNPRIPKSHNPQIQISSIKYQVYHTG